MILCILYKTRKKIHERLSTLGHYPVLGSSKTKVHN